MNNRRKNSETSLGAALDMMMDSSGLRQSMRQYAACAVWPEAAGAEIAAVTLAQTVRGGVLFVLVKSAAWANELAFYKPELIERINKNLGAAVITDIHFKIGASSAFNKAVPDAPIRPTDEALDAMRPTGSFASAANLPTGIEDPDVDRKVRRVSQRVAKMIAWKKENGWRPCKLCGALCDPSLKSDICPICNVLRRNS
jgi:predicted nucleic acid-binding Zn ribbon protein